jgi:hypothetical protein
MFGFALTRRTSRTEEAVLGAVWVVASSVPPWYKKGRREKRKSLKVQVLSMPNRTRQLREKRLREYLASAPPGAPPPVEIPGPPDTVSLSVLFGILSVAAPLVSSLLVVVVFGPAAVVCGLAAIAQGRLKGLIGLALGVVSLTVCGLIFFLLLQG